ncbi:unnamed protein product, partial [marine sediment metagenome]
LEQAMHDRRSKHSCLGCHDQQKEVAACAGCHAFLDHRSPLASTRTCDRCHQGPPGDSPRLSTIPPTQYARFLESRRPGSFSFKEKDLPGDLVLESLARDYQPARFPHRRVIDKLKKLSEASKLARHFHGSADTLCQGCHHQSPVGKRPPRCSSCHNPVGQGGTLYLPRLQAAYHLQCIGCHQKMGLEPGPYNCVGCHPKK